MVMEIAEIFGPLRKISKRYKFYYGGRGGGKSWGFADSLLLIGRQKKVRAACVREVQDSIKDSVHKLLSDRIRFFGLNDYRIMEDSIVNQVTGTEIIFKGLKDQNAKNIKSLEGIDICWIEEGQTITKNSWDILDPTIRKEGSEIWVSMNRDTETDPLWKILAANPDDDTLLIKVNWYDNPFCTEETKRQALKCKDTDYEDYLHIWEGEPKSQGDLKLIGSRAVRNAFENTVSNENNTNPLIIGVDVARFGDDKTAISRRKGRKAYKIKTYKGLDTVAVANEITNIILTEKPARVNIDAAVNGAGVVDILVDRGYGNIVRGINFGSAAQNQEKYANRRAEMWDRINNWLNAEMPVALVDAEGILEDLTAPNKQYDRLGRLLLEKKEDIKKRLGRSTDMGDALALTFAEEHYPSSIVRPQQAIYVDDKVYVD